MLAASGLCRSRQSVLILAATAACLLFFVFTFSDSLSRYSSDYARKAQDYWSDKLRLATSTKVYNCADPFRRPGYLHIEHDPEQYRETRWIPYTDEFLNAPVPAAARYPATKGSDVYFNDTGVDQALLKATSTPQQWMQAARKEDKRRLGLSDVKRAEQKPEHFVEHKDEGGLGWLWGRRVLILGDSVDRFMVQFFCEEFGRSLQQPPVHRTTGTCTIPTLNLTLIHWHLAGSYTYRPDWWWMDDMNEVAFEDRWKKWWAPTLDTHVRGPNGRPDLLLWQSGLWDQRAFWEAGEAHFPAEELMGTRERQLVWDEVRFVAARIKKLVGMLHDEFGADVPAMFRAITQHRDSNAVDANIYELDRISRAIAEQAGHEMFEWGRIITAFSMLYKDKTHTGKGPASWLWGNMILEYVARSAGAGDPARSPYFNSWAACHPHLVNWGGR